MFHQYYDDDGDLTEILGSTQFERKKQALISEFK